MSTSSGNSSDTGPAVIAINSVLAVVATAVVALRFWSRKLTGAGWGADEYLALTSLLLQHAVYGLSNHAVIYGGLGRDINVVIAENPDATVVLLKVLFILCFIYGVVSPMIKLSVLFFYMRIFPTRGVRFGSFFIGSLCIGWFIAITTVNSIQCKPISAFWNPVGTYKCINLILYFIGNSIANCVIDILTLALPIREVLRLNVSPSKKAGLCGIFLLGGIVVIASFIRFISLCILYKTGVTNLTQQYVTMWIATCVEIYIATIGACLPTIVPAYRKLRYGNVNIDGSSAASRGHDFKRQTPLGESAGHSASKGSTLSSRKHVYDGGEGTFELLDANHTDYYSEREVDAVSSHRS